MKQLFCLIIFFSGCVSFNSGKISHVTKEDFLAVKTKRIVVNTTNVVPVEINGKTYAYSDDERIQRFGLFSTDRDSNEVQNQCKEGTCKDTPVDIQIYADVSKELVTDQKTLAVNAFFYGLTLGLIPAVEEYRYKVNAVAVDSDKKIIGTYHYEDTVKTYFQLFLIFVRPFLDTQDEESTLGNMVLKTVIDSDNDSQKRATTSLK